MQIKAKDIKLIIVDPIAKLCSELEERFAQIKSVSVVNDHFVSQSLKYL
ncbi:MAG: hypothetical protein AAF383_10980 [Cyanobacteria bacterium P01_A01_bin.83]